MGKFSKFARIAEVEFSDIVLSTQNLGHKLRIYLYDKTFIDFFYTIKTKTQRFSVHWERSYLDKTIYRLDNTPDQKWSKVKTFPLHFHKDRYENVEEPPLTLRKKLHLEELLRSFLNFVKNKLKQKIKN